MEKPDLKHTLNALMHLRTAKGQIDESILNKALTEVKKHELEIMLRRVLIHVGDISRQHNILRELGIVSKVGGAQERATFRAIIKWWSEVMPESFKNNLRNIVEFSVYENLMFYQNTTYRYKGDLLKQEVFMIKDDFVYEFLALRIRKGDEKLVARHLPKYETGRKRVTKVKMKKSGFYKLPEGKEWFKHNGTVVLRTTDKQKIDVKEGDVISYPREKQSFTIEKQQAINSWINGFCNHMGWTVVQYKQFRKKQGSAEQIFSSKTVLSMPKSDYMLFLDGLTAGQRFRVAKMVTNKSGSTLIPVEKWNKLGDWYIEWENNQENIANELREAAASGDTKKKEQLMKKFKVKATGMQTIDMLVELFKDGYTEQQINNTYQALIEKMDLIANVFVIVDGSGSMSRSMRSYYHNKDLPETFRKISLFHVAATLAITFSTRNPNEDFRNTFGWFSNNFKIMGKSKFKNTSPNPYVARKAYQEETDPYDILSEKYTFSTNFKHFAYSNPGEIANTNMFASVEHFVNLVKLHGFKAEDLPVALLFLTDGENNSGKSMAEAMELAYSIGWKPLMIFWGMEQLPSRLINEAEVTENVLTFNGFSESTLSQILRGIKTGSVDPQDQLWSIHEDKRYSIIK